MIIAMTAYNRPRYLAEVLGSILAARREIEEPLNLVCTVDPSDHTDTVCDMIHGAFSTSALIFVNKERLGLQANTYQSNCAAFELARSAGEDYVLGLPDDIVLAHDALKLAVHLRDYYREDPATIFTSLFCSGYPKPADYKRIISAQHFHCQAWGTWTGVWENDWKPLWNHEDFKSWDQNVNDRVMQGRWQWMPYLSRVRHIGREGTHATAETFVTDSPKAFADDVAVPGRDWDHDAK